MSDDIQPRVDEDGLLNCDQKCQHFRTENRTLTGVERYLCAQSCAGDICPVTARRNAGLLRDLRGAIEALGAMPDGYCFCSKNRDPMKATHEPECRDIRALLERIGE